ncbi:hypothetical protein Barba22A_gp098 [Rheinheimera phage vB_RspM_Barba22A]|jgi:hypothetical protein|uniref:Head decoration protein n=85 Tax=Barbavirus TaxID=2733095 RepID=A0A7G9VRY7_9CAUD|nr:hypothetical protein HOV44_gp106 [Rheinheimera phage Barba5S]YP_009822838.1 hypothetical protein HOV45_gp102 [Rheinheimera phage Barba8S]YP_009822975.1 hypothetical protein HOV46_gp098 [Rheinheimera phage vB_RspM_Barba18A]YP_009823119.1 hypothetical protein HOV47_gp106 [Rheinheimera phage vB_RspM_Barba19A]YP_009823257.1 hypothetical protein HOV48_gp101 [Rheinheimera phage Barba21A]QCQ57949.1 hypothetical protein Barba1A_gp098 [Rheinheimera phage vB_RspM_Barba1A]QCQ58085.1 hypothetical prot
MAIGVTKVASDFTNESDLIKHESGKIWGYCRGNVTVAAAKVRGDLIQADGALAATEAAIVGVVINDTAAGESAQYLKRGECGVLKTALVYAALTPATVDARLEALGIQVIREYV